MMMRIGGIVYFGGHQVLIIALPYFVHFISYLLPWEMRRILFHRLGNWGLDETSVTCQRLYCVFVSRLLGFNFMLIVLSVTVGGMFENSSYRFTSCRLECVVWVLLPYTYHIYIYRIYIHTHTPYIYRTYVNSSFCPWIAITVSHCSV